MPESGNQWSSKANTCWKINPMTKVGNPMAMVVTSVVPRSQGE
jgi:hypothetical protein